MNILFVSLVDFSDFGESNIYTDLLREFMKAGHIVYAVSPVEKRSGKDTSLSKTEQGQILKPRIGNIQKTGLIEKGISTVMLEPLIKKSIRMHWNDVKFDLVLYPTPPITFSGVVDYVRKRDGAKSCLLLKDIFPQNAVDIGIMSAGGLIYKVFRRKEKKLYAISDYIGCMSEANIEYLRSHNEEIPAEKVFLSPNSLDVSGSQLDNGLNPAANSKKAAEDAVNVRAEYGIPENCRVFLYGGNLGKPQNIDFIIQCLEDNLGKQDRFFVICGSGTDYAKLEEFYNLHRGDNLLLINGLPKDKYLELMSVCDIGLIFLDYRFTIPNYPSRLLDYLKAGMPVAAFTDISTDLGTDIKRGGFGWWGESRSASEFTAIIDEAVSEDIEQMGIKAYKFLNENFKAIDAYKTIVTKIGE